MISTLALVVTACGGASEPSQETSSESETTVHADGETVVQAESATLSGTGQYTLVFDDKDYDTAKDLNNARVRPVRAFG